MTRKKIVEMIAECLIVALMDQIEDAASDLVEEVLDDETLVWNRLKLDISPEIIEEERLKLAHSVLRSITHKLAMGPVNGAEDWEEVRDKHPSQLMLL